MSAFQREWVEETPPSAGIATMDQARTLRNIGAALGVGDVARRGIAAARVTRGWRRWGRR
ncbi:MAG: hypothetical protein RLZZ387_3091 [Chloroflexota bacterium]|jgi:hypothetical protein